MGPTTDCVNNIHFKSNQFHRVVEKLKVRNFCFHFNAIRRKVNQFPCEKRELTANDFDAVIVSLTSVQTAETSMKAECF